MFFLPVRKLPKKWETVLTPFCLLSFLNRHTLIICPLWCHKRTFAVKGGLFSLCLLCFVNVTDCRKDTRLEFGVIRSKNMINIGFKLLSLASLVIICRYLNVVFISPSGKFSKPTLLKICVCVLLACRLRRHADPWSRRRLHLHCPTPDHRACPTYWLHPAGTCAATGASALVWTCYLYLALSFSHRAPQACEVINAFRFALALLPGPDCSTGSACLPSTGAVCGGKQRHLHQWKHVSQSVRPLWSHSTRQAPVPTSPRSLFPLDSVVHVTSTWCCLCVRVHACEGAGLLLPSLDQ